MRTLWQRTAALLRARRLDRELDEEIATHLAMQEEEFRKQGMDPAVARAAARREFGGVAQVKETYRERRGLPWLETAGRDIRYAVRGLWKSPGFTAAAVVSLALGIGANTAVFSLFHTLMLRMLPVRHPEELVSFYRTGGWGRGFASYPLYLDIAKRTDLFQGVVARTGVAKVRFSTGSDRLETAEREYVSGNYFGVLGIAPAVGRLFTDDDNRTPHAHPLAVLSYEFWRSRFGADPRVVGRPIVVDEQPLTVIGVAARGFRGVSVESHPDLWVPAMMAEGEVLLPRRHWVWILARRMPGVSHQQVQSAMNVLMKQHLASIYGSNPVASFRRVAMAQQLEVRDGAVGLSVLRDQFGGPLTVLMAAVGLVLLVACANVAHLLLARGASRQKEIAMRISLGATRGRLIRQGLTESLLLAGCGALGGILLAYWGIRAIVGFLPAQAGEPFTPAPDGATLAFTISVSLLAALLFGLAPAFRSTAVDPATGLKNAGSHSAGRPILRRVLVTAQVAFSVVLVVLAGLFGHSLAEMRGFDTGFRNQNVIAFTLDFPNSWKPAETANFRKRFVAQIESLPGVSLVSYGAPGPFLGGTANGAVHVLGSEAAGPEPVWVDFQNAAPRYFELLGSPLIEGREFERNDGTSGHKAALVNEAFARRYFPGRSAVGQAIDMQGPTYIVGVVRDIPHRGLRTPIAPTVYTPLRLDQEGWEPTILVGSAMPVSALVPMLRREVAKLSTQVAASDPKTIRQQIDESIFQDRLLALLGGFFGVLALALAGIGLYGVVAYGTARRAREIGIRMALGARRGPVVGMVMGDALWLVLLGIAAGMPLAFAASRQVGSVLFGIKPADPLAFAGTAAVLAAVGLAAALIPARRAAGLDPMHVLRQE